jgi:hypothetical protein
MRKGRRKLHHEELHNLFSLNKQAYYQDDHVNEDEMGGARRAHEGDGKTHNTLVRESE